MSTRLAGKAALVTAAAQGIGLAIAQAFLREGARVIAIDLQADKLERLQRLGAETLRLDVTDRAAVNAAARACPGVQLLVNAVGYVAAGPILDCSPDDFERSLALNVVSMFNMCSAFLPGMVQAQSGSIINIASVVSSTRAAPNRFAYGTSKGAVIALTKSIARDYAAWGVRCNSISPGTVETPSLDQRIQAQGEYQAVKAAFVSRQPMGRLGRPDEIAEAAVFLASAAASFTTGADFVIDGGMSL